MSGLARLGIAKKGAASIGISRNGIAGISEAFNPIQLNPLQYLYLEQNPEVIDKTANALDAVYVDAFCATLDGVADKLTITNQAPYQFGSDGFVLSGWINPNNSDASFDVVQAQYSTSGALRSWLLVRQNDQFIFFSSSDGTSTKNVASSALDPISTGEWAEYSVVKYGGSVTFLVNGQVIRKASDTQVDETLASVVANYTIGDRDNGGLALGAGLIGQRVDRYNKDEIDVYILFGQSNASGWAIGGRATPLGDIQHHSYTCDVTEDTTRTNVLLTDYSVYNGTELKFGSLATEGGCGRRRIAIVKVSEGGVGLEGKYSDTTKGWSKSDNYIYPRLISAYQNAKTALEGEGYVVNLKGAWAMVGENDCSYESHADSFAANAVQLISDLRSDLGVDFPVVWCRKHATLPRTYTSAVRAAEDSLPSLIDGVTVIDTDSASLQGDDTHFDSAGLDAIAKLVYSELESTSSGDNTDVVSHHLLSEGSGTTSYDTSGNGNHGTWTTGAGGTATIWGTRQNKNAANAESGSSKTLNAVGTTEIAVTGLVGTETTTSTGTATVTASAGKLTISGGYVQTISIDGLLTYQMRDAYDAVILSSNETWPDGTLTGGEYLYIPSLDDGTDDVLGLGLTNGPCGADRIWNNFEGAIQQKAENTEFLDNAFWSADGVNYDKKGMADFLAHLNFENNVVISRPNQWSVKEILTWAVANMWTPSEYIRMINWLAAHGSVQDGLGPLLDDYNEYIIDDDGYIIFED